MAIRKPFSLTYVTYEENDKLGYLLALISLSPMYDKYLLIITYFKIYM